MEANKDPWKDWLNENKEAFNQKEPRDLWADIETALEPSNQRKEKVIPLRFFYRIAAVFVLSLGLGYYLMYNHFSGINVVADDQLESSEKEESTIDDSAYPIELIEAENYYAAEIDQRMNELIELTDDETIMDEIDFLRTEFDDLRKEMGDNINDEKVVQAMIQNYRLRLELLKEIIDELKTDSAPKNEAYEKEIS